MQTVGSGFFKAIPLEPGAIRFRILEGMTHETVQKKLLDLDPLEIVGAWPAILVSGLQQKFDFSSLIVFPCKIIVLKDTLQSNKNCVFCTS